ncbi:MAG: MBG domain-containing protein [Clostridia bacterium]|nr:MBG domain-containing protein [Clostridia bacterium]
MSVTGGLVYNGKAHTPEVTVELGGVTLTKDKDYTVGYAGNINAGTAKVTVYGAGNYNGIALGSFEIEKRNVEIRWNRLEAEFDGTAKSVLAFAEGLVDGESLSVMFAYELDGHTVTPVNAGIYTVYAAISTNTNYKLAPNAQLSETFVIKPKTVEAVWGTLSFVYNGKEQAPKATYTNVSGTKLPLTVTVSGAHTDADTYTATATMGDSNYAVSAATANMRYTIAKKAVAPVVGADTNPYDGKAFVPEITVKDLNGDKLTLTYEYFKDGASLGASAPVNVGKYVARVTLSDTNYALADSDGKEIAYYDFAYTITASKADGSWTFADNVYSGSGKAPEFSYTDSAETLGFTVTYGKDKGDGTAEEYTEDKPVLAGNYVAKIVFDNGNYTEELHAFTITKKTVTVSWSGDELSVIGSGNSYRWLYDGKEHAPVATATADGEELALKVAGQTNAGSYTATATLEDNEINKNFTLSGNTHAYSIVQSTITAVKWYEYGATNPVADGAKLSYQYISVYGWDGPKLSAYGVATMQGQGTDGGTVTRTVEVPMAVTYQGNVNTTGYWSVDTYTAVAAVRNGDRNGNCTTSLAAADMSISFAVTEKQLETTVATIVWAFDADATEDADNGVYYWIYDGKAHAPEARLITSDVTYDPDDPDTYEVLPVGGKKTDAGRYYAYILPSCGYDIDEADADKVFEIRPREITIAWSGVGGAGNNFDWTYDGQPHAPVARVVSGAGGLTVTLEAITEYTDAGNYVAYARTNANFIIKEDETSSATQNFSIKQLVLDPEDIVWTGKDGSETDFTWIYDGTAYAPSATLEITLNGETVKVALKVTGEASTVGDHTAYAMLDSTKAVNANFVLKGASCGFKIENGAIAKIEWEGAENGENLEFTYDGKLHTPKAYYWLDGDKVYLNVIGGAVDAGEYVAYVTDYTGVTAGMSHVFTVKPAELTVSWAQTSVEYDKAAHSPVASFTDADGNEVTLTLGRDYAVSAFSTAGTYTAEITFLNKNYTYSDDTGSVKFTVTPKKVFINWTAKDDGTFNYEYNGKAQKPAFTCTESGITINVTGAETAVGTYVAVATADDGNYILYDSLHSDKAEREFSIVPFAITVDWKGENGSETDFEWEYSGVYVAPTATYKDWNGDEQTLTVRGERMDAGKYTATAVLPQNCSFKFTSGENAGTHSFEISPKLITDIVWEGENGSETDFEWVYTGKVITPVAKTADGDVLSVAGGATDAGDYVASAVLPNEQNYKFGEDVGGTQKFKITEKTVDVLWYGKDDSLTDFTWEYTGSIIRPAAKFVDVDGEYVEVPVNGGASSAGQHTATAADVFTNYVFSEISATQVFTIKEKSLTVTWSDNDKLADGVYTYEYNGKAQMPLASADENVNLSYTVKNADGEAVGAVIGAGEYTVTIEPADKNYVIGEETATVKVKITPKTVEVKWQSNLNLIYTGSEVAPEAWFIDADNQAVALKVTGAQIEAGEEYEATADFIKPNGNYVLKTETVTVKFDIVKNTDDLVWDWENGEWKKPETSTEPDGGDEGDGEGGETGEPVTPPDPSTEPTE